MNGITVTQRLPVEILKKEPRQWDDALPELTSTPRTYTSHSLRLTEHPDPDDCAPDEQPENRPSVFLTSKLRQTQLNVSILRDDESTIAMVGELDFNCTFQTEHEDEPACENKGSKQQSECDTSSQLIGPALSPRATKQTVLSHDLSLSDRPVPKEFSRRPRKTATEKKAQRGSRHHSVESRPSTTQPVGRPRTRVKAVSLSPKKGTTIPNATSALEGNQVSDRKFKRQTQLTTYGIRRTARQFQKDQERVREANILTYLRDNVEAGMKIILTEEKGRGVVATRVFHEGEFVVEYAGELISEKLAKDREMEYKKNPEIGSFMFYFVHAGQKYCVDATKETSRLGRLINHSRLHPNCHVKVIPLDGVPRLVLFARQTINPGEEFLYDYGDRDKASLEAHPWLRT